MTTDTVHKIAGRTITVAGKSITFCGMAKGAAMIAPNMGTMLGLVLCDAAISPELRKRRCCRPSKRRSTASASTDT
ncbi:MAG: bifunctional ornithine acetyltransferase/N-acetylglutamate synthase [Pirellulales bacterium]